MIYEHEIPSKSKLYFAHSAQLKREIEYIASSTLIDRGYKEIVTPFFSYHQHQEIDEKSLIRFNDNANHLLSLRADSTLDVVRVITKRLGRSIRQKRWFYIQPVFRYPSHEQYQIGAEYLENSKLSYSINDMITIIKELNLKATLQISNIKIPRLLSKHLGIDLEIFKSANLQEIFGENISWLSELASLQSPKDIRSIINDVPDFLKDELKEIENLCCEVSYNNLIVAPLFYSKMRYYDGLFFRILKDNNRLGMGGIYNYRGIEATGFALYTDNLIEELID